jgi:ABC-type antimicrobial peptide transport system permease subunit
MTTRNKHSRYLLATALLLTAGGVALGFTLSICLGLVLAALVVRYRREPAAWDYFCFVALALAMVAWNVATDSKISPLLSAIPLMLSYVFDYLDERKRKRAVAADATLSREDQSRSAT